MLLNKLKMVIKNDFLLRSKFLKKEENLLALKISIISFFSLFLCLSFLILLNWFYLITTEKNTFIADIEMFKENVSETLPDPFFDSRHEFIEKVKKRVVVEQLLRDSIIVNKDGIIQKLWIFQYIDIGKDELHKGSNVLFTAKYDGNTFLMYHVYIGWNEVYFSRNITYISLFQTRLIINAVLLSILFFIIIFFFSIKLSRLTIRPIKEHNKKLKEYNHNLAHELKTPLAVLKSNIELAEMTNDACNVRGSKEEIDSMEEIINGLLFLSESHLSKSKEKIFLHTFLDDFIPTLWLKKIVNYTSISAKTYLEADKTLLKRLFKNLLENADKYGDSDENFVEVVWTSFYVKNKTNMQVDNDSLFHIFEPFYQIDVSRNNKGYGLGLSIVKRICESFSWQVSAKVENGYFIVEVKWK